MIDRHRPDTPDAASRLGWAFRRYLWLVAIVLGFSIGAATTVLVPADNETDIYRAEALVIARQLAVRVDQLPKSSKAIFEAGTVAERAVLDGGLPYDPDDLIPTSADIEPIDNTPLVRVIGLDKDPQLAARIANAAAVALAEELSAAGPGFGIFAVHELARPPAKPEPVGSLPTPLLTGSIAGISLAAGLIALIMLIRQPIVTAAEAEDLTGIPEVGHLSIRRGIGQRQLQDVVGLGLLVRSLFPERPDGMGRTGTVIVVGCGWKRVYSTVVDLLIRALHDYGPARAVPLRAATKRDVAAASKQGISNNEAMLVIGPSTGSSDIVQLLPVGSRTVLLVKEGVSRTQLKAAVTQLPSEDLMGFVFVVTHNRILARPQLLMQTRRPIETVITPQPTPRPADPIVGPPVPAAPTQSPGDPVVTDLRGGIPVTRALQDDAGEPPHKPSGYQQAEAPGAGAPSATPSEQRTVNGQPEQTSPPEPKQTTQPTTTKKATSSADGQSTARRKTQAKKRSATTQSRSRSASAAARKRNSSGGESSRGKSSGQGKSSTT